VCTQGSLKTAHSVRQNESAWSIDSNRFFTSLVLTIIQQLLVHLDCPEPGLLYYYQKSGRGGALFGWRHCVYIFRHVEQLVSEVCFCCVCATALLANAWRRSVIVRSSFADRTTTCSTTTVADLLIVVLPGGIVTYVLRVVVIHTGRFVFISYAGGSLLTMCTQHVFAAFTVVYCLMRRHVSAVFSSLASCCSGFWASSAFSISYLDAVRDLWEHYGGLNFY